MLRIPSEVRGLIVETMDASLLAILSIFALVAAAFVLMIVNGKKAERQTFEQKIRKSWGTKCPRLFLQEELSSIRSYSDSVKNESRTSPEGHPAFSEVDEITAKDVDLDSIFSRISGSVMSSPGAEVLYAWLRHPLLEEGELKKRMERQDYLAEHDEQRSRIQKCLSEISFLKRGSFHKSILSLKDASPIGRTRFLVLGIATLMAVILLFFFPLAGIAALIPLLIADYTVHMGMKERTLSAIRGFQAIVKLIDGADSLIRVLPEEIFSEEIKKLQEDRQVLGRFRSGAFFVTSGGSVGSGIGDAILEYVKLFFHVDLIQFDRMLESVKNQESDVLSLLAVTGSIDAECAAASYRLSLEVSCRPELSSELSSLGNKAELLIEGLAHPSLENPVRNDLHTDRSILLTGSNASGKSTFLRAAALSAILAQSIGVVSARRYRAPFFRIFSSMAIQDNLVEGESYFIVEIKSLKRILDASAREGAPVLAFIDEVLRGTNTVERIAASAQILLELEKHHGLYFAATHDIELSYLLEEHYENLHFQESTVEGDLHFDYILRPGRAEAGNALALLGSMNYPEDLVDHASLMVSHFEESGEWELPET